MALGSRQYIFEIELANVDDGIYETLSLRTAKHPSETEAFLATRVIAYALEHAEGIGFTKGLAEAEPAIVIRDLTGRLRSWIDIGTPDAARLHKASKASDRVAIYCHKTPDAWLRSLKGERIHEASDIEITLFDRTFVDELATTLERRNHWSLSITEGTIYLEANSTSLTTQPVPHRLG